MTDEDKPAFDPDKPFHPLHTTSEDKPPFDPSKPFQQAQPSEPDTGMTSAALHGAAHGATFNFADELAGVNAAGPESLKYAPGLRSTIGAGRLARQYLMGDDPEATQTYEKARDEERKANELAQKQHPYVHGAAEIAGAIPAMAVLPEASFAKAPSLLRPVLKGAQVGSEYGAASGVGEGKDLTERGIGAGVGAGTGAVGGGVGGTIAPILGQLIGKPLAKAWGAIQGWKNPEAEASRRLGAALLRDQDAIAKGDAKGLSAQDWLAAKRAGEPVTLADLGAGNTQAILRSAGNTSPEAWAKLEQTFNERFHGQSERVAGDVRNLVAGGANAGKTADQLVAEYDRARSPAYKAAFNQGDKEITSPAIEQLMSSPKFVQAMKSAVSSGQDRAVTEGYGAFNPGVTVENGMIKFTKTKPNGVPQYPNLQYWDAVKKELDSAASMARRSGDTSDVSGKLATSLRQELDKQVPSYANARGIASQYFGESNALEAGQKLAGKRVDPKQIVEVMRGMKPDERELFREGYASDWADRVIKNISDTRDITKAMFNSPNERARALAVFGQAGVTKMQARMALETIMHGAKNAMGNSTTAKQLIEAGMAGGLIGGYEGGWDLKHIAGGAGAGAIGVGGIKHYAGEQLAAGSRKLFGSINSKTASHVADLLTSNDITKLNQGLQLAMKNRRVGDALRSVANYVALGGQSKASSAVASGVPKRLMIYPQRAEQDDQNKPTTAGFSSGGAVHAHVQEQADRVDTKPTDQQKEVGNYRKGHVRVHGLPISIENPKGSYREGKDANGKPWRSKCPVHYGYVKKTEGADGDHVDIYVGPKLKSPLVYVIDQHDYRTGKFDEHKAFIGFENAKDVRRTYHESFTDGRAGDRLRHMAEMTVNQFKAWLKDGDTSRPLKKKELATGGRANFADGGAPNAEPDTGGEIPSADTSAGPIPDTQAMFTTGSRLADKLLGTGGQERYQTWPEKLARSALDAPHAAMTSVTPVTSEEMIAPAQDIAGIAGGAGIGKMGESAIEAATRAPSMREFWKPAAEAASDTAAQGAPLAALEHAPKFYSGLEKAVEAAPLNKASGQQWLGTIGKGVKKEELEATGTQAFLEQNRNNPMTKQEVLDHVGANKVELGEVNKGGGDVETLARKLAEEENGVGSWDRIGGGGQEHYYRDARKELGAKFSSYQLPGGENYRERLLTLPRNKFSESDLPQGWRVEPSPHSRGDSFRVMAEGEEHPMGYGETRQSAIEQALAENNINPKANEWYKSSHWDEPNVLVHRRTNEREVNGVPSLHVEEIQSDWHQKGRQQGYKTPGEFERLNSDLENARGNLADVMEQIRKDRNLPSTHDAIAQKLSHEDRADLVERRQNAYNSDQRYLDALAKTQRLEHESAKAASGVPDAPFKKNWHELALKDALREAAENGINRISWTPGEAQAARYDLSKQIERIHFTKTADGQYLIAPEAIGGREVPMNNGQAIPVDKLADYIGKETADKIVKKAEGIKPYEPITELPEGYHLIHDANGAKKGEEWGIIPPGQKHARNFGGERYSPTEQDAIKAALDKINREARYKHDRENGVLENVDLKIGGEGMKGFYDKMIPDALNKIGKPHGVKVERGKTLADKEGWHITPPDQTVSGKWMVKSSDYNSKGKLFDTEAEAREVLDTIKKREPVHYMDIPPSLRDQALKKGFSLFEDSSVGAPLAAEERRKRKHGGPVKFPAALKTAYAMRAAR